MLDLTSTESKVEWLIEWKGMISVPDMYKRGLDICSEMWSSSRSLNKIDKANRVRNTESKWMEVRQSWNSHNDKRYNKLCLM